MRTAEYALIFIMAGLAVIFGAAALGELVGGAIEAAAARI